jgi:hypothetical protein
MLASFVWTYLPVILLSTVNGRATPPYSRLSSSLTWQSGASNPDGRRGQSRTEGIGKVPRPCPFHHPHKGYFEVGFSTCLV